MCIRDSLDNVLRSCTDVARIRDKCTKESDLATALTFAKLAAFQVLKLLWFQAQILVYQQAEVVTDVVK